MSAKTKQPKVTIIIPVYNAEQFIERCLNSIFAQTYTNIEVICINDGSLDKTYDKLKELQKSHANLIVFDQKNQGASAARNAGLQKATGEYVTFVDSDDAIKPDFVEQLVNAITDNDIALSGYERRYDNDTIFAQCAPSQTSWAMYKLNSTCGKLYRHSFLRENKITFSPKYKIGEDMFFSMLVLSHTNKVKPINYIGYINYLNQDSVTHINNTTKENRNTMMLSLLKDIEAATQSSDMIPVSYRLFFYLKSSVLHLLTQRHLLSDAEYYQEYKTYFTWLTKIYKTYGRKISFYNQKGEEPRINFICNIFVFAIKTHTIRILLFVLNHIHIAEIK